MVRYRVRHGRIVSGVAADGATLRILDHTGDGKNIYHDVECIAGNQLPARPHVPPGEATVLVFKGADNRNGGDLLVPLSRYPELVGFPDDLGGLLAREPD